MPEVLAQELGGLCRWHKAAPRVLLEVVRGDEGLEVGGGGGGDGIEESLFLGVEAQPEWVRVVEPALCDGTGELVEHARVDVAQAREGEGRAKVPL